MVINPYVLLVLIALSAGYFVTEKVKGPVKAAYHQVEKGAKKVGRGAKHVLTLGHK